MSQDANEPAGSHPHQTGNLAAAIPAPPWPLRKTPPGGRTLARSAAGHGGGEPVSSPIHGDGGAGASSQRRASRAGSDFSPFDAQGLQNHRGNW